MPETPAELRSPCCTVPSLSVPLLPLRVGVRSEVLFCCPGAVRWVYKLFKKRFGVWYYQIPDNKQPWLVNLG